MLRIGSRGRGRPLLADSGDIDFVSVYGGGVAAISVDNLGGVDSSSLIFGVDGAVRQYCGLRHWPTGVPGMDVAVNRVIHFVLALYAAAEMESLCAKFGALTACACELKKSSSSDGGLELKDVHTDDAMDASSASPSSSPSSSSRSGSSTS